MLSIGKLLAITANETFPAAVGTIICPAAFVADKMEQWYREAGASSVIKTGPGNAMGASTHAYGGTRMGNNSETNVVNRWGFSHEAPNLGILGASVMGSSGARNPTLTAQALSWRTAEYLANNWRSVVG